MVFSKQRLQRIENHVRHERQRLIQSILNRQSHLVTPSTKSISTPVTKIVSL